MRLWSRARGDAAERVQPAVVGATPLATSIHQCDAETLLPYLQRLIDDRRRVVVAGDPPQASGFAVFFIELRRSDRTQALAGMAPAKAAIGTICQRLAGMLRDRDRFALYGLDEILLVLPEVDSPGRALLVASRLVQELRRPIEHVAIGIRVRPAIGCALFPAHGDDAEELIFAADRASRDARTVDEGYRIAVRGERAISTAPLSSELETALRANQLEVWLQPQLNLRNGLFDAAEALIRWPRPENLAPVSPIATVELAEANGMMTELTLFVLNTVLRQSAQFAHRGIDLRIAINVSASMLTDANLPMTIAHALELWDVKPDRLTLEVTENTLMQDVERSLAIMHELKSLGTHLSLDDFGTGYSSFAYLRRMPLDELKIDQLFVRNLSVLADGSVNPQREGDLRIVRSIIDIAHNFDLHTVAEGVEDQTTLDLLGTLGCDVIQGYFTGRPMRIPAFEPWWNERRGAHSPG
jgi:EAL domain-containing protein (putative c-di-GMP-specific phosphodiesterase class I)/GGDEF domain-containing protein